MHPPSERMNRARKLERASSREGSGEKLRIETESRPVFEILISFDRTFSSVLHSFHRLLSRGKRNVDGDRRIIIDYILYIYIKGEKLNSVLIGRGSFCKYSSRVSTFLIARL